jgi:hypothetical protein
MQKLSNPFLNQMRQTGDPLADEAIASLFRSKYKEQFRDILKKDWKNSDKLPAKIPKKLKTFFDQSSELPTWADSKIMLQGSKLFEQYSGDIMGLLGSLSLPYCYAAADGARVLQLSERIRKDTQKRLAETGQFVLDVLSKDAFLPEGKGIRSIQKVRLIHAAIRYHIKKSDRWEMEWGLPINQEDMAGTNLAFSFIILRGLRKTGRVINPNDAYAYQHLWNVIGYMLGQKNELIPQDLKEAYQLTTTIEQRHFKASEAGKSLTKSLLDSYAEQIPVKLPDGYLNAYMRYVLGDEVADMLDLPPSNWTDNLVKLQTFGNTLGQYLNTILNKQIGRKFETEQLTAQKPQLVIPDKLGIQNK